MNLCFPLPLIPSLVLREAEDLSLHLRCHLVELVAKTEVLCELGYQVRFQVIGFFFFPSFYVFVALLA